MLGRQRDGPLRRARRPVRGGARRRNRRSPRRKSPWPRPSPRRRSPHRGPRDPAIRRRGGGRRASARASLPPHPRLADRRGHDRDPASHRRATAARPRPRTPPAGTPQAGTPRRPIRCARISSASCFARGGRPSAPTSIRPGRATVELAGHSGMFDYIELAREYAPYDLFALENLARAVDTFPHMSAMMKIEQQPRTYVASAPSGRGSRTCCSPIRARRPTSPSACGRCGRRRRGTAASTASGCGETSATWWTWAHRPSSGSRRRRGRHHDREGAGRGRSGGPARGQGRGHGPVGPADYSMSVGLAGQWEHRRWWRPSAA